MRGLVMKKILVIGPALAEWSEIKAIEASLQFLVPQYSIDFIDPLEEVNADTHRKDFFAGWHDKLQTLIPGYHAIFGFSLGGVILQHCLDLVEQENKPLVFISVPSFSDDLLSKRLDQVIRLIKENLMAVALHELNRYVFYPYEAPQHFNLNHPERAALRLSRGLQFVLEADSRPMLQKTRVTYLHLIGENSQLVNSGNVITSPNSQLVIIPRSGMRVLQNNLTDCMPPMIKFLEESA